GRERAVDRVSDLGPVERDEEHVSAALGDDGLGLYGGLCCAHRRGSSVSGACSVPRRRGAGAVLALGVLVARALGLGGEGGVRGLLGSTECLEVGPRRVLGP